MFEADPMLVQINEASFCFVKFVASRQVCMIDPIVGTHVTLRLLPFSGSGLIRVPLLTMASSNTRHRAKPRTAHPDHDRDRHEGRRSIGASL
jgi:hypothetical protein